MEEGDEGKEAVRLISKRPHLQPGYLVVPRLTSDNFTCCHTEIERGDHDFVLSRSHYTDSDTEQTNRERMRRSNPRPRDQESHAIPTELPRPH